MGVTQTIINMAPYSPYGSYVPIRYIRIGFLQREMEINQPLPTQLSERGVTPEKFKQTLMRINEIDFPMRKPYGLYLLGIFLLIMVIEAISLPLIMQNNPSGPGPFIGIIATGFLILFISMIIFARLMHQRIVSWRESTNKMIAEENQYYYTIGIQMVEAYVENLHHHHHHQQHQQSHQTRVGFDFLLSPGGAVQAYPVPTSQTYSGAYPLQSVGQEGFGVPSYPAQSYGYPGYQPGNAEENTGLLSRN